MNTVLCKALALAVLLYILLVVIHRLLLSPLARFPGPKLSAATGWYEFYHDVIRGGQFMFEIESMHAKYGPIVRINPFELHIKDPDFYTTLYAGPTKKRNKYGWLVSVATTGSSFAAADHRHHRVRRGMLSPFLARRSVMSFQPVIHQKVEAVCQHLRRAMNTDSAVELHTYFLSFAVDVISHYAFGDKSCVGALDEPVLSDKWKRGVNGIFESLILVRHLPFLFTLSRIVPPWLSACIKPQFTDVHPIENEIATRMTQLYNMQKSAVPEKTEGRSIFSDILGNEQLPDEEKELSRLIGEAKFLLVAGTDAPSQVLALTMFHILDNPDVYQRLREEVMLAIPDKEASPCWDQMEKLPYLSSVIKEGLRISAVVTSRLPRISPDEPIYWNGWEIPPGTPVSMSIHFILRDPTIFPDPLSFQPGRWADKRLEKYLVPFCKGNQGCLGPDMAYCWLNIVVATLLRRFEFELYDTTKANVEIVRDCFNAQTRPGLNCIHVKVRKELDI